jgi:MoxR-like ATPase
MDLREKLNLHILEIKKALFGMDEVIKIFCLTKAVGLSTLLLGDHGVAKSDLFRKWSISCGLDYRIVTSSEVDEGLLAYIDPAHFRKYNEVKMRPGELMLRDHILIDEYFLWNNKYRAKLHQLLEEGTYAGCKVQTKAYTFSSTPLTEYYAGQISDVNIATQDRIDTVLLMFQPDITSTEKLLRKFSEQGAHEDVPQEKYTPKQVISWDDYIQMRKEILKVEIPPETTRWLILFAESMASCKYVNSKFGVSKAEMRKLCRGCNEKENICSRVAISKPRFIRATVLLAKAIAWFNKRDFVDVSDVREAIKYTLPHRLVFLRRERNIQEALSYVKKLVAMFDEEYDNWKSRGIFQTLEAISVNAKSGSERQSEQEVVDKLLAETQECLPISKYVNETIRNLEILVKSDK